MSVLTPERITEILCDPRLDLEQTPPSGDIIWRFQEFFGLLDKWNQKINLTSEKTADTAFTRHGFDSLHYLRWIQPRHQVLDIGSGAGFPGIPIKIFHPELQLTLIESQRKRCNFLRESARLLKLDSLSVVEGRAESFFGQAGYSGHFDRVVFRGFGSLDDCLAFGVPFLKPGGQLILMKGPEEIAASPPDLSPSARLLATRTVEGMDGKKSLMIVIEKCST